MSNYSADSLLLCALGQWPGIAWSAGLPEMRMLTTFILPSVNGYRIYGLGHWLYPLPIHINARAHTTHVAADYCATVFE